MTIRLILVDDQTLLRSGFRMILEAQPDMEVVGESGDGQAAIELVTELKPDVVLMDVRMPGIDGIEATAKILERVPESRVLILTTFDLDEYVFAGLRAGASGFLLKDVPPEELLSAIRAVANGDAVVAPSATRRLLNTFIEQAPPQIPVDSKRLEVLTPRELEVLIEVGQGHSNTEIAARLFLSESTVKTHINRILAKLSLRDRVQAVVLAYDCGIVKPLK